MACPLITVETGQVSPRDRIALWSDALAQVCGRLDTDALGAPTLDATMAFATIGQLRLGHIAASRHRIGLTPALARTDPHPVAKVIVQTVGTSRYEQDGEVVELGPGDGLVYDVSRPHVITSPGPTEHLVVIIPHELLARRGVQLRGLTAQRFSTRDGVGRLAASLLDGTLHELTALSPDCEAELAAAILGVVLLPVGRASTATETLSYRIKRYIRAHLRDPELSIGQIAAALGCSTRYLHRAFAGGETITDHIWRTRVEACRDELERCPDRTISEVAFAWGFSSSAHFSRLFRQRFAMAPSALRRARPA